MVNYRKPELGKDELEGFENYAKQHYQDSIALAWRVLNEDRDGKVPVGMADFTVQALLVSVFEKIATPKVFLIESWRKLEDSERLSYYSKDYQDKTKAEAEAISKKASEALSQ